MADVQSIRNAIIDSLPAETSAEVTPLSPGQLYIPRAHIKALQLFNSLIIGARGVGKSTWTAALSDQNLRSILGVDIPELERTSVQIGFSAGQDNLSAYPSTEIFANLLDKGFKPYEIWQTVVLRWIATITKDTLPEENWETSVIMVKNNPEDWIRRLQAANSVLQDENKHGLIIFDALDRSGNTWERIDEIVRDLLSLTLRLKSYSHIHLKIFLREDQYSRNVTNFPDASKLLSTETKLDWSLEDLHGLLWQILCNGPEGHGGILRTLYKETLGADPHSKEDYWVVSDTVKRDEATQRKLFEVLAGPWMGKNRRRGVPYFWAVRHLADGRGLASPRSFLVGIRDAAEKSLDAEGSDYPLHYESLKKGIQKASKIRVDEMAEDYPWVKELCGLLDGLNVPSEFSRFEDRWKSRYPDGPSTIKSNRLPPQSASEGWTGIKQELVRLGVFEETQDSRINMPDLYRVGFGLGRMGGVAPLKRSRS